MSVMCPATMCPLFAPDGSPWTGNKNAVCPERYDKDAEDVGCAWYGMAVPGVCGGMIEAHLQILTAKEGGGVLQIGPRRGRATKRVTPQEYDCPRAHECQWQRSSPTGLCPPRTALREGIDPRYCAY